MAFFRQTFEGVVEGLKRSSGFFGGLPKFLVIDNFPDLVAAVPNATNRAQRALRRADGAVVARVSKGSCSTDSNWQGRLPQGRK